MTDSIFRKCFDSLTVGAAIIQRKNRKFFTIHDVNQAAIRLSSWKGTNFLNLLGARLDKLFVRVKELGLFDEFNRALDGNEKIQIHGLAFEDIGIPSGIFDVDIIPLETNTLLITFSNITSQTEAEDALRSSEERFRAMTESSPDHVMLLDLEGNIQYINRTVPDLTVDDVLGKPVFGFVPERYAGVIKSCFDRVLEHQGPDDYLVEYVSTDTGETSLFETHVGPILQDGRVQAYITTSRDVTRHREAEAKMQSLSMKLLEAQEEERRTIAQELHDEVGGLLTAIQISLELIPADTRAQVAQLNNLSFLIDSLQDQVREVTLSLRPQTLDHLGLYAAIKLFCERFSDQTRIRVYLDSELEESARFASEIETAIFRLVQEALTNVARHAQVGETTVNLLEKEQYLIVEISDNGIGFDSTFPSNGNKTLGLSGMHHRASVLGGKVTVSSIPGEGTTVRALFPLKRAPVHVAN